MVLKAILLGFDGVVIKDIGLRERLIDDILIAENLRPNSAEYAEVCAGRSDRACLDQLLTRRGRVTTPALLDKLQAQKAQAHIQQLAELPQLPIYPGLSDLLYKVKTAALPLALVANTAKVEVDWILAQAQLTEFFSVMVTAQDLELAAEKPAPQGYELAIARLNEQRPELGLQPENCLAVEARYAGITAAQSAQVPVVGVAHYHPYRMVQRRANWVVDYLNEIDFDWIREGYGKMQNAEIGKRN
ncbi:MAG: HAD family hydrolase [Leptolyngbyaceae cyanobacterium]